MRSLLILMPWATARCATTSSPLAEALSGMRFGPQHAHAAASLLRAIDLLDAELADLQERVTVHLAGLPSTWGVDSDGVTGPQAGAGRRCGRRPAG